MKVRVVIAFGVYRVGDIIPEMPSAQAEMMRARGFVEYPIDEERSVKRGAAMRAGRDYVTR